MVIGNNVNMQDRLIQKTTGKASKGIIENKANNKNNTSNTSIASNERKKYITTTDKNRSSFETIKMTFYIKNKLYRELKNYAYWERLSLTEAFNRVMTDGLKEKKREVTNK